MAVTQFIRPDPPDCPPGCSPDGPRRPQLAPVIPLVACPPPAPPAPPARPAPQPSVGRVVHYVSRGSMDGLFPPACRAALITEVGAPPLAHLGMSLMPNLGLQVVNPTGTFYHPLAGPGGGVDYDGGVGVDLDAVESLGRVGPCCTGLAHRPGSWHWPALV